MQRLLAVLVGLAGFLATHGLVGRVMEERPDLRLLPGSTEAAKYRHWREHADDYDLVYVGTSRVFRGFEPEVFDATLAELGHPLRSYNFGLLGMGYLEERYLVDWILERPPARLRWILVEPTVFSAPSVALPILLDWSGECSPRDVLWHTPEVAVAGLHGVWGSERPRLVKWKLTRAHLAHAVQRFFNVGVGASLVERLFLHGPGEPRLDAGFAPRQDHLEGFDPEAPDPRYGWPPRSSAHPWMELRDLAERAAAAGIEVRFVSPPGLSSASSELEADMRALLPNLLLFPLDAWPELAETQRTYFFDREHLNLRGAELFSRRLAHELAPLLAR